MEGKELNITHCALATKSKSNDAYKLTKLYVATKTLSDENTGEGTKKFVLCSLRDGQSCKIDATFFPGDQVVKFLASGPNTLHLTGVVSPHEITVETYEEEEDDQSIDEDDSGKELESAKGTLSPGIRESNNEYDRNSEEMDSNGGNQEEDSEEERAGKRRTKKRRTKKRRKKKMTMMILQPAVSR